MARRQGGEGCASGKLAFTFAFEAPQAVRKLPFHIAVSPAKAKYFPPNFARSVAVVSEFRQEFGCEIELFEQPS